jgi:hypothetical protein
VFDYCWFTKMSCLTLRCQKAVALPPHSETSRWDPFASGRFASYAGYGNIEELETATSLACGHNCNRIYGGYISLVRVWDVAVPGRSCRKVQLFRRAHSAASGQMGLVSCIYSCVQCVHGVAVGSFSRSVAVYDDRGEAIRVFDLVTGALETEIALPAEAFPNAVAL